MNSGLEGRGRKEAAVQREPVVSGTGVGRWVDLGMFWRLMGRSFYHEGMGSRVTMNTNFNGKGAGLSKPVLWGHRRGSVAWTIDLTFN